MRRKWHILYYETAGGKCLIQDFIDSRKGRDQAKIFSWLALLEEHGANLPRPYSDILTEGVHELRIKLSGEQVRMLYLFFYEEEKKLAELSLKIFDTREHLGLSQKEVAKRASITQQQLSKLENGINCTMSTFLKVCNALSIKINIEPPKTSGYRVISV